VSYAWASPVRAHPMGRNISTHADVVGPDGRMWLPLAPSLAGGRGPARGVDWLPPPAFQTIDCCCVARCLHESISIHRLFLIPQHWRLECYGRASRTNPSFASSSNNSVSNWIQGCHVLFPATPTRFATATAANFLVRATASSDGTRFPHSKLPCICVHHSRNTLSAETKADEKIYCIFFSNKTMDE
jgi:hypothetical protein